MAIVFFFKKKQWFNNLTVFNKIIKKLVAQ